MAKTHLRILYVGSVLPSRTETPAYREILALRDRGQDVIAASIYRSSIGLGTHELDELAQSAILIYAAGFRALLRDACVTLARTPMRAAKTIGLCLSDIVIGRGVPLLRRPQLFKQALAGLALARRLRQRRVSIDCIHAHRAHVPASVAMYAATTMGVPFSFTGRSSDLFDNCDLLPAKLRRASFVACNSYWHRDFYRSVDHQLHEHRLPIIRSGVDCAFFAPRRRERSMRFKILAIGRFVEKKGIDILVAACKSLVNSGHDFECTIVGDGPEAPRLRSLIRNAELNRVVRLVGNKNTDEIRELMRQSDVLALPCRSSQSGDKNGIPVAAIEAMAAGLLVVASDLTAIRDLVRDGETGLLARPNDADSLAQKITEALENPSLRNEVSARARRWVENEFSLDQNVDRLLAALRKSTNQDGHLAESPQLCPIDIA
jgi:glycosyltransferase involved in cell wall biosynthesis